MNLFFSPGLQEHLVYQEHHLFPDVPKHGKKKGTFRLLIKERYFYILVSTSCGLTL